MIILRVRNRRVETAAYHIAKVFLGERGGPIGIVAGNKQISPTILNGMLNDGVRRGDKVNVLIDFVPASREDREISIKRLRPGTTTKSDKSKLYSRHLCYKIITDTNTNEWIGIYSRLIERLRGAIDNDNN